MCSIKDNPVSSSTDLTEAVSTLAGAVKMDDWLTVDDTELPLRQ